MAHLPGMLGEVFWGKPGAPLPNWREHDIPDADDDDDRPKTEEEKQYLADVLGLTLDELEEGASGGTDDRPLAT